MKFCVTYKELNTKIIKVTLQIREKYPELSDFLNEMPVTIPNETKPEINAKTLKEYYESLYHMLKNMREAEEKILSR